MAEIKKMTLPVGRIVAGHPFKYSDKDANGVQKKGKDGNPVKNYFLNIAIPKTAPECATFFQLLNEAARSAWPTLFDAQGRCMRSDFAWKFTDGDSTQMDKGNRRPCDKEGFPGHWVIRISSSFPHKVFKSLGGSAYQQVAEEDNLVKTGDYVKVAISITGNNSTQTPGVYINSDGILFYGVGDAINFGINPEDAFGSNPDVQYSTQGSPAFGGAPVAGMPPVGGAPVAGMPPVGGAPVAGMPPVGGAPVAGMPPVGGAPVAGMPPVGGAPVAGMPPVGGAPVAGMPPVQPNYGFVDNAGAAADPVLTYGGVAQTKSQWLSMGWTEAQIAQYMK